MIEKHWKTSLILELTFIFQVFKPFGYEIIEATLPVPTVHMLNEPSCGFIFSEWLRVSQKPQPSIPPKEIPESFSDEFLLNGYAGLTKVNTYDDTIFILWLQWYFNDHSSTGDSPRNWNRTSEFMSFSKAELGALAYNKESGKWTWLFRMVFNELQSQCSMQWAVTLSEAKVD